MPNLPRPLVSVIIPCYNKESTIARAIEGIKAQTVNNLECFVINDSSTDNSEQVILDTIKDDKRFHYKKVQLRNVALVRSHGASLAQGQFLSFLDGDDWVEAEFLETCVKSMIKDRALAIAYTGLRWYKPDGTTGISKWPGDWNYDAQIKKQNQIPTCSVIRRVCWERLGGQRARYCGDLGAGSEDGEFYLRAGAYGFRAEKVTKKALFNYSWMSGLVSGDPNYKETDWTAWHPWAGADGDGKHPFGSYATPENHSHPVRQYDEPTISVIIPVGLGHEQHVMNALDSLEAQTFRQWEVIVVDDTGKMPGWWLKKAYPYVRYISTNDIYYSRDGGETVSPLKPKGSSYARNRGAEIARAPLLLPLDADDWLYPTALEKMLYAWNEHQSIIYTDYTNRAIVNDDEVAKLKSKGRWLATLETYEDGTHLVVSASKSFDYDCARAQLQPQPDAAGNCYIWCTMMSLIPTAWHREVGGFDEKLPSWEDVDYHWRLAKLGKCYYRIEEQLLVYNYHMGHRRERGRQTHEKLLYYLIEKHKELDVMACRGCSKRPKPRSSAVLNRGGVFSAQRQASQPLPNVDDGDFLLCWYIDGGNISQRVVVGAALHNEEFPGFNMVRKGTNPDLWAINYGYFGGGRRNKVLVHRDDIVAQPHMWEVIEDRQAVAVPEVEQEPLGAPELVNAAAADVLTKPKPPDTLILDSFEEPPQPSFENIVHGTVTQLGNALQGAATQAIQLPDDIVQELIARGIIQPGQEPQNAAALGPPLERTFGEGLASDIRPDAMERLHAVPPLDMAGEVHTQGGQVVAMDNPSLPPEITIAPIDVEKTISGRKDQPPVFELQKIPGVNVNIAEGLVAAGCKTREDVAALGADGLMAIKGIGEVRAGMILGAASSSPKANAPT